MAADDTDPEPLDPSAVDSWDGFTTCLRELHRRCGRPTYDALSARTGLPKSAISYLVGRNPVRTPSESTVLRFVEGCLGFAGQPPDVVRREVERWRTVHRRLTTLDIGPTPAPTVVPAEASPGPFRRRTLLAVGAATALLALALAVVLGFGGGRPATTGAPAPVAPATPLATASGAGGPSPTTAASSSSTAAAGPRAGVRCVPRAEPQSDARMKRDWPTVYYCPNRPAEVFTWAREDGSPIADLESQTSWFVCWTEGRARDGGTEVFYYTQGDTTWRRPDLDAWGFVPGSSLGGAAAPVTGLDRRCPFRAGG